MSWVGVERPCPMGISNTKGRPSATLSPPARWFSVQFCTQAMKKEPQERIASSCCSVTKWVNYESGYRLSPEYLETTVRSSALGGEENRPSICLFRTVDDGTEERLDFAPQRPLSIMNGMYAPVYALLIAGALVAGHLETVPLHSAEDLREFFFNGGFSGL